MNRPDSVVLALLIGMLVSVGRAGDLDSTFKNPPDLAKPRTWWHWVSGNVSSDGITKDLEAMKRVGVGGAQLFTVDQSDVKGPVVYMSQEWRDLVKHAIAEANRLGLELTITDCEGWSESGGPWITPALSMQKVVWSEDEVAGGSHVELVLAHPETVRDYYEDIAVLAFPTLAGEAKRLAPTITTSGGGNDAAKLTDGDLKTRVEIEPDQKGAAYVLLQFKEAPQFGSVVIAPVSANVKGEVQISDDGKTFKKVGEFSAGRREKSRQVVTFPAAAVHYLRLYVPKMKEKTKWSIGEIEVGGARIPDYVAKSGMAPHVEDNPFASVPSVAANMMVDPSKVIDLTKQVDAEGKLSWDPPSAGTWTILRIGHTSTGVENHPTTPKTRGLECDKLSAEAVRKNWDGQMATVIGDSKELIGKGLKMVLMDSWEAGCENWTPKMREEFKKRRGYEIGNWLIALTGRYVKSPMETERFLWDYRRTLADLVAENHYGLMKQLCHENKLQLTAEAVGIGMPTVADELQCKGNTDVPMGEFWVDRHWNNADTKEAASAAHIFGTNIAAAESFTAQPQAAGWRNDPYSLKALGDRMFCEGVNRYVFHRYAHQPDDRVPGMTMGPWGINFERSNTWWDPGSAWLKYVARCEQMLQSGRFVADVLYLYGEGAPVNLRPEALDPAPVHGFDYDAIDAATLLSSAQVKDGEIALKSGMTYRVLVLPKTDHLTPAMVQKVRDLVNAGATVVGQKPVASPSLNSAPAADDVVKNIGEEVWGNVDGKSVTERPYGKGRVIWGKTIDQILQPVGKDFEVAQAPKHADIRYIHRRDQDTEIYFISNQREYDESIVASFRVTGKQPELWNPMTGEIADAPVFTEESGRTLVPMRFDPAGSMFVIFRKAKPATSIASITRDGQSIFAVSPGNEANVPKFEIKKAVYGVMDNPEQQRDVTEKVKALVEHDRVDFSISNDTLGGDPAALVKKQFRIDYTIEGKAESQTLNEGDELQIPPDPTLRAETPMAEIKSGHVLVAWTPGQYDVTTSNGQHQKFSVDKLPAPVEIGGAWQVSFQAKRGAPESPVTFDQLVSWTDRSDPGVKFFSGTATYEKDFDVPADLLKESTALALDLGIVKNLAEVSVNGTELGIVWKPPFRISLANVLKAGKNHLTIKVTNLWPNRLIGDQSLPVDKRVTWTSYNPYKKDSPLIASGLLGPVKIEAGELVDLKTAN